MRPRIGHSLAAGVAAVVGVNKKYAVPNQRNQTLDIPGIAKLTFNRVTQQRRYISADALVIDAYNSKTTVVIGHSAAGVVG
jgi:hypothetical protein